MQQLPALTSQFLLRRSEMQHVCLSVCLSQIGILILLRQRVHLFHFVLNKISGFFRGVPEDCNSAAPLSASDQFAARLAALRNMPHQPVSSYTKCPPCSSNKVAALCKLVSCYSISIQFRCSPAPHRTAPPSCYEPTDC